jgi:hypothetical protein
MLKHQNYKYVVKLLSPSYQPSPFFVSRLGVYSDRETLQARLRGETDPQNADILFLYGRSLFEVGKAKSDVLGGKSAEKKKPKPRQSKQKLPKAEDEVKNEKKDALEKVAEQAAEVVAEQTEKKKDDPEKPLFQFTGDENFEDDSDDEEEEVSIPKPLEPSLSNPTIERIVNSFRWRFSKPRSRSDI